MRYFLFFIFFTSSLFSLTINDSLLKIHATLIPKISLMDYGYKQKCEDNLIVIYLVYDRVDYLSALSLKKKIDNRYKDGINSYKIDTKLVLYGNIRSQRANVYYLFPTTPNNIKKTVKIANKNSALTFSYLKNDLQYGVMMSLNIGTHVKPILNLQAIKANDITLRPILLDISTVYLNSEVNLLNKLNVEGFNRDDIHTVLVKISYTINRFAI